MTKVLVTGCAGYVGSTLVGELLARGYQVLGVDNLMHGNGSALLPYLSHPAFTFLKEDVRFDPGLAQMARACDVVIPLAALVGAPLCEREPRLAKQVNRDAIVRLLGQVSKGQRILYPNTNSGYGSTDGTRACTEDDPLSPISVYGVTKCEGEKAVLDHPNGVSFRLATVFGVSPRMRLDLMVNDFTVRLLRDKTINLFEPHFLRNFVGVRDVARAFVWAVQNPDRVKSGAYNLGLPTANMTKMQLAQTICEDLDLPPSCVTTGDGEDPDKRNYLVSNDKILATGFWFEHDLHDGICQVAQVVQTHTPEQLKSMRNI